MYEYTANVIRIIDGDTVELDVDLGFRTHLHVTVRLAGIDAPELRTPEGPSAAAWLTEHATVPALVVRTDKDRTEKYGRYLAWLWAPTPEKQYRWDTSINMLMVDAGMARLYGGGKRGG